MTSLLRKAVRELGLWSPIYMQEWKNTLPLPWLKWLWKLFTLSGHLWLLVPFRPLQVEMITEASWLMFREKQVLPESDARLGSVLARNAQACPTQTCPAQTCVSWTQAGDCLCASSYPAPPARWRVVSPLFLRAVGWEPAWGLLLEGSWPKSTVWGWLLPCSSHDAPLHLSLGLSLSWGPERPRKGTEGGLQRLVEQFWGGGKGQVQGEQEGKLLEE